MKKYLDGREDIGLTLPIISLIIIVIDILSLLNVKIPLNALRITYLVNVIPLLLSKWLDCFAATLLTLTASIILKERAISILTIISLMTLSSLPGEALAYSIAPTLLCNAAIILKYHKVIVSTKKPIFNAGIIIATLSLIYWLVLIAYSPLSTRLKPLGMFEAETVGILTPITVAAYFILLCYSIYIVITLLIGKIARGKRGKTLLKNPNTVLEDKSILKHLFYAGLTLAILMPLIPYIPSINSQQVPVNTDWVIYYEGLLNMDDKGLKYAFEFMRGSRPLYILAIYHTCKFFSIDFKAFSTYHNIVLLPLYAISLWFLAKSIFDEKIATYTLLITPLTPMYLGFILGGLQANLFTLTLLNMALAVYFRVKSIKSIPITTLLLIIAVMCHPWVTFQYLAIIIVYLILCLVVFKRKHIPLGISLAIAFIFIAFCTLEIPSIINAVFSPLHRHLISYGFEKYMLKILKAPQTLYFAVTIYLWGALNNLIYPILAIYGLEKDSKYFLVTSTAVTALIMFPLSYSHTFINRLLLNTHLPILAACTMAKLGKRGKIAILALMLAHTLRILVTTIPNPELSPYLYLTL